MLMMTTYKTKPFMTQEENQRLMDLFAENGTTAGTVAHYTFADSSGGVVIVEADEAATGYRNILNYGEFVEYETKVLLSIDDALPHIADALAD